MIEFILCLLTVALVAWVLWTHVFDLTFELPKVLGALHTTRIGFSHDVVYDEGGLEPRTDPYMERWILWLPWAERYWVEDENDPSGSNRWRLSTRTLRVHKFFRGDDDSAPHDHPWWFWTFPLRSYSEVYWDPIENIHRSRIVKAFRWHYRPATHRHYVVLPAYIAPVYTIVWSGGWERKWGFWPDLHTFVYWRDWIAGKKS